MFAIRGGGHTWWAGAANIQDGVTIDLSEITQVVVSEDRTTTSVGGGCKMGGRVLQTGRYGSRCCRRTSPRRGSRGPYSRR